MLGSLFAVVVSLMDGPVKPVEPEVVVGGLIRLGEAWKLSVTRSQRAWSLPPDSLLAKLKANAVAWPEK